jgi:hypothetical protein
MLHNDILMHTNCAKFDVITYTRQKGNAERQEEDTQTVKDETLEASRRG